VLMQRVSLRNQTFPPRMYRLASAVAPKTNRLEVMFFISRSLFQRIFRSNPPLQQVNYRGEDSAALGTPGCQRP
jgi:hypothetical protein